MLVSAYLTAFHTVNKNENDSLKPVELMTVMRRLGWNPTNKEVADWIKEFDTEGELFLLRREKTGLQDLSQILIQGIMSQCRRFPTMWFVRPAKPRISLRSPLSILRLLSYGLNNIWSF